ncbi:MAG: hypothetical protein Q8N56_00240, partial [bacterium]|nr:hypothetical protein [bacterium]
MKEFLFVCINRRNTKYFTYLRFLIIGLIFIPVIFILFKTTPVAQADTWGAGYFTGNSVTPATATTTITVSGHIYGSATQRTAICPVCGGANIVTVWQVAAVAYQVDGGSWIDMTPTTDWFVSVTGSNYRCQLGNCANHVPYEYNYSKSIDISGLLDGAHTIIIRATDNAAPTVGNWTTSTMNFTKQGTLTVNLTTPTIYSSNPLMNVSFTANVTGSSGNTTYSFYCLSTDTTPAVQVTSANTTYTTATDCDYMAYNSYTVKVRAVRGGYTAEDTLVITIASDQIVLPRVIVDTCTMPTNDTVQSTGTLTGFGDIINCYSCTPPPQPIPSTCCKVINPYDISKLAPYLPYWEIIGTSKTATTPQFILTPNVPPGSRNCSALQGNCSPGLYTYNYNTSNIDVSDLAPGTYSLRMWVNSPDSGGFWGNNVCSFTKAVTNSAPSIPTLIGPVNGSYLNIANPSPTFSARVTDSDVGQTIRARFDVSGFGPGTGTFVTTGLNSVWGPVAFASDNTYSWRAYAEDNLGAISSYSGYWSFTRDTIRPGANLIYTPGTVATTNIVLTISGSDERTGIAANSGRIEVSTNGGSTWSFVANSNGPSYTYVGTNGTTYIFRYRVTDGAGNDSLWTVGGSVTVTLTVSADLNVGPVGGPYTNGPM